MINKSCDHFLNCGGCFFDKINSNEYKKSKKDYLYNDLSNLTKLDKNLISKLEFIWTNIHSRRKLNFQINNKNELGFFAEKTNNFIKINECLICDEEIFKLKIAIEKLLKSFPEKSYNKAIITKFDNIIDIVLVCQKEISFNHNLKIINFAKENNVNFYLAKNLNEFVPIYLHQKSFIKVNDLKLYLDSNIFIQASDQGLDLIIKNISNFLSNDKISALNLKIADLYSGFGVYSFAISRLVKSISTFEGSSLMVDLIKKNSNLNNLNNKILAEKRDLFNNPLPAKNLNKFDIIIINPPRNGAQPQIQEIAKSDCKKLIYVSCNPKTFANDSKILLDFGFKIEKLICLDQFVGSKYFELISFYER